MVELVAWVLEALSVSLAFLGYLETMAGLVELVLEALMVELGRRAE